MEYNNDNFDNISRASIDNNLSNCQPQYYGQSSDNGYFINICEYEINTIDELIEWLQHRCNMNAYALKLNHHLQTFILMEHNH